jgi:hypothetical protein
MSKSAGIVAEYSEVAARHASGCIVRACTPCTPSRTQIKLKGHGFASRRVLRLTSHSLASSLCRLLCRRRCLPGAPGGTVAPLAVLKSCSLGWPSAGLLISARQASVLALGLDPLLTGDQMAPTELDLLPLAQARGTCTIWLLLAATTPTHVAPAASLRQGGER